MISSKENKSLQENLLDPKNILVAVLVECPVHTKQRILSPEPSKHGCWGVPITPEFEM